MAGTITHYKIGKEVLAKIDTELDPDIFLLACQGHDLLYFIKLKDFFKYNKNRAMVKVLQDNKFDEVVMQFLPKIKSNKKLKSFLYGYITHHITDSVFHPFIIYHSGIYKKNKETKKYQGRHEQMESVIDALLAEDIHKIYKEIPKMKKDKYLEDQVEEVFKSVYDIPNMGTTMIKQMGNVPSFLKLYRSDRTKIKKLGYKIIDKITGKYYEFLSFNYTKAEKNIILDKKVTWHNPLDNDKEISSIEDLYQQSINNALKIINKVEKGEIKKADVNISAITGRKFQKNYTLKYFID